MQNIVFAYLILGLILVSCGLAGAEKVGAVDGLTKVWVAAQGSDTTGNGTQSNPYLTIEHALTVIPTNVEVNVLPGVYTAHLPTNTGTVTIKGSQRQTILSSVTWSSNDPSSQLNIIIDSLYLLPTINTYPFISFEGYVGHVKLTTCLIQSQVDAVGNGTLVMRINNTLNHNTTSSVYLSETTVYGNGTGLSNFAITGVSNVVISNVRFEESIGTVAIHHFQTFNFTSSDWTVIGPASPSTHNGVLSIKHGNRFWANEGLFSKSHVNIYDVKIATLTKIRFYNSIVQSGVNPHASTCDPYGRAVYLAENIFDETHIYWNMPLDVIEGHGTCLKQSFFLLEVVNNQFNGDCTVHTPVILDFSSNWFGSSTGPNICSNPGGTGAIIGFGVDYSFWCLDPACHNLVNYPRLLPQTVTGPCQSPTPASIATFIVLFFLFVGVIATFIVLYCFWCSPRKTDTRLVLSWYASVSCAMAAVLALLLILLSSAGVIGAGVCPTRVYAAKCPFTTADKVIASGSLVISFILAGISIASFWALHTKNHEHRSILYTVLVFQSIGVILALTIGGVSLHNLSSPLRGPYMHLLIVPAAGYVIFCVLQLYHYFSLIQYCRPTLIAMQISDYKTENSSLLAHESTATSSGATSDEHTSSADDSSESFSPEIPNPVAIDEYATVKVEPFRVFYSDYVSTTKKLFYGQLVLDTILFGLAIAYAVSSYKAVGGCIISTTIVEALNIGLGIFISSRAGPLAAFKVFNIINPATKFCFVGYSAFLIVQMFALPAPGVIYGMITMLTISLFVSVLNTSRMYRIHRVVIEKNSPLVL